ncbi:carboxypeptidase regulatory-like domain-containing protein [Qipengyuania sp. DSG2-2]|uniref:carboxypeptidase-like regulatory domain-containing protein n=1 Tax=Qipengyuania sp. DGS2-2 TaxID=3349631 RepID=UPI0036D251B0
MGAAAAFAAALSGVSASPAFAQDGARGFAVEEDDFLMLQMKVGSYSMPLEIRGYQINDGDDICLDLADVIQSLELPVRLDKKSRRATGWLFSEDQSFTLDRAAGTVQNVNNGRAPVAGDITDTPEGWCVETGALSRWFGVTFRPDIYNAVVSLESDTKLPFIEAIERRSRAARLRPKKNGFDLAEYPRADADYRVWRTPSVDVVARTDARKVSGNGTDVTGRYELFAAGELLGASVEARLASDNSLKPQSLRVRAFRQDPDGNLLGPLKATQVVAGDVTGEQGRLTAFGGVGRGAYISNQPLGRTNLFTTTVLRGTLPAGWDAELYRNGQLIAFQAEARDGRYEFEDVELFYGRNDFEVVLYGPQGQEKRERTSQPVGYNTIEPGKTYYWAHALQDNTSLLEIGTQTTIPGQVRGTWRLGAGLEHGIDEQTSIAAGVHSISLRGRRRNYAEATLNRTLGSWQIEATGAADDTGAFAARAAAAGRVGRFNLGANALWVNGGFESEFVAPGTAHQFGLRADTSLRLGRFSLPLQASVNRITLKNGSSATQLGAATSFNFKGLSLTSQLSHQIADDAVAGELEAQTELKLLANARVFGLRLRGTAEIGLAGRDTGLRSVRVATRKSVGERSDLSVNVDYLPKTDTAFFNLGFTRLFDQFAMTANTSYSTAGAFGAGLSLAFSLGPDPANGGVRVTSDRIARRGQAVVSVFLDENGDGVRGEEEPFLPEVDAAAGMRISQQPTNEDGRTVIDGLQPYKPVLVRLDEGSLGDPYLAPGSVGTVIVPRPGVPLSVELPVTRSGEVEGLLLSTTGYEMQGVQLELLDARGQVVSETVSEFDGFFLFDRVPYGTYRLRVAPGMARRLEVKADLESGIRVGQPDEIARLGTIKMEAGPPLTIATGESVEEGAPGS